MPSITAWLQRHRVACFGVMTLSFLIFGWLTLDLIRVVQAALAFVSENGWQGLRDGGLIQLAELLLSAIVAMVAYLLFKLCEYTLVHSLHP